MLTPCSKKTLGSPGTETAVGRLKSVSHFVRRKMGAEAEETSLYFTLWKGSLMLQMETMEKCE